MLTRNIRGYLGSLKPLITTFGLVLALSIGLLDFATGHGVRVNALYLAPVALVTGYAGRRRGYALSVVCGAIWLICHQYLSPAVAYWNTLVSIGVWLVFAAALSALHESRQMQQELTQFIVHDIRSPLTNVQSGLEILQELQTENTTQQEKRVVELALLSSKQILTLADSLLDIARMDERSLPLDLENVEVDWLVAGCIESAKLAASRKRITLKADVCSPPAFVRADRKLTLRVLNNLFANALKFSPAGSTITISAEPSENHEFTFSVADEGPGIPRKWVSKVFDKYGQIEAHNSGVRVGFGLGLAFCKLAVIAQSGRIWLESEEGMGSAFRFTLPAVK